MATVYPVNGDKPYEVSPQNKCCFTQAELKELVDGDITLIEVNSKLTAVLNKDFGTGVLRRNTAVTKLLKSPVLLTGVTVLASPSEVQELWHS